MLLVTEELYYEWKKYRNRQNLLISVFCFILVILLSIYFNPSSNILFLIFSVSLVICLFYSFYLVNNRLKLIINRVSYKNLKLYKTYILLYFIHVFVMITYFMFSALDILSNIILLFFLVNFTSSALILIFFILINSHTIKELNKEYKLLNKEMKQYKKMEKDTCIY